MNPIQVGRLVGLGFWLHFKHLSRSGLQILLGLLLPPVYATIALYLLDGSGASDTKFAAVLGAGLMGVWSTTLFGCGAALQQHRRDGTLPLMVGAPAPLPAVLLQYTLATAGTGLYALIATVSWGWLAFGVTPVVHAPGAFVLAVLSLVISLAALGLLIATVFVLIRNAYALTNLLDFPVWLACGLLAPTTVLPHWVHPISAVLSPTWGARAVRAAASGNGAIGGPIWRCLLLGGIYLVLAVAMCRWLDQLARRTGSLSLT